MHENRDMWSVINDHHGGNDVRANEKGRDETGKNHQARSDSSVNLEATIAERV